MENKLEYRVGGLEINFKNLSHEGIPDKAKHRFVVKAEKNVVSIYVAEAEKHFQVAVKFDIHGLCEGGGSFYLDKDSRLNIRDFSSEYDGIPKDIARVFGEKIVPELEKRGINVNGIIVNDRYAVLNYFWVQKGWQEEV